MSQHFSNVANDPNKIKRLIKSCKKLIALGFDGIDLDWEHPGDNGKGYDYDNFVDLVQELRNAIGEDKLLTAAFGVAPEKLQRYDYGRLNSLLDYYNMMTYDLEGSWSETTGHNSALYSNPNKPNQLSWNSTYELLKNTGIQLSKVNFGIGFYGRGVNTTTPAGIDVPIERSNSLDLDNFSPFEGSPYYSYIIKKTSDWDSHWDDIAKVPFLTKQNYFLSYDNPKSVSLKTKYVNEKKLGGVIVWGIFGDITFGSIKYTSVGEKLKVTHLKQHPLIDAIHNSL